MKLFTPFFFAALTLICGCTAPYDDRSMQAKGVVKQIPVKPRGEYAKIDTSAVFRDAKILAQGSDAEKNALVEKIKKNPGAYAPPVFMGMAQHLYEKKDAEGAYFWFCFGRMRGRYDAERCADADEETPYSYDHRWLNLHGLDAFGAENKKLSLPESQWPDLLKKVRDEFLKGAEEIATHLKNTKKE